MQEKFSYENIKLKENMPINFVETIFQYLSPFSAHTITYENETFATLEHAYQSLKFIEGPQRKEIKNAKSPMQALRLSHKHRKDTTILTKQFDKDHVMETLMRLKLEQHPDIKDVLLATGERGLLKVYPTDYYWGTGEDGTGNNKMGKIWMKIRSEIQ